ncbi:hypothetical protein O3P69_004291 [Scylla paramamosain]|uniref:Uncharacterized protein n=1 Tax=Scylla paramamosain TaxID=85552 RepID=A0AAW0UIW3_SCYPA
MRSLGETSMDRGQDPGAGEAERMKDSVDQEQAAAGMKREHARHPEAARGGQSPRRTTLSVHHTPIAHQTLPLVVLQPTEKGQGEWCKQSHAVRLSTLPWGVLEDCRFASILSLPGCRAAPSSQITRRCPAWQGAVAPTAYQNIPYSFLFRMFLMSLKIRFAEGGCQKVPLTLHQIVSSHYHFAPNGGLQPGVLGGAAGTRCILQRDPPEGKTPIENY